MPRGPRVTYQRQDVGESPVDRVNAMTRAMRQPTVSAYAAKRFQEWQENAPIRQQNLELRNQILQSQAELTGLKDREALYHQGEIDRQTKMFLSGLPVLREQLKNANIKPGSQEYAAEISAFAQHVPDAFVHVPEIQQRLTQLSQVDQTAAEIADKIKTFQQGFQKATGQVPGEIHVTKEGDISGQGRAGTRDAEEDLFKSHKITPTQFLNVPPEQLQLGNVDTSGVFKPDIKGKMIQFPAGVDKKGAARSVRMSIPEFNQRKLDFTQQQSSKFVTPQVSTQTNVPITTPTTAAAPAAKASLDDIFGTQTP